MELRGEQRRGGKIMEVLESCECVYTWLCFWRVSAALKESDAVSYYHDVHVRIDRQLIMYRSLVPMITGKGIFTYIRKQFLTIIMCLLK